jgi:hypothetical protein
MKSSCLAGSLLKVSGLLESRLKVIDINKTLTSTHALLREANRTIRTTCGMKMAKFLPSRYANASGQLHEQGMSELYALASFRPPAALSSVPVYRSGPLASLR